MESTQTLKVCIIQSSATHREGLNVVGHASGLVDTFGPTRSAQGFMPSMPFAGFTPEVAVVERRELGIGLGRFQFQFLFPVQGLENRHAHAVDCTTRGTW